MARKSSKRMAEINVVPYVDVMLVLLIIFMVTAPLLTQGFEVRLPETNGDIIEFSDPVVVTILADKSLRINIGDRAEQAASLASISTRLRKIIAQNRDLSVLVEADQSVLYGEVAQLLSALRSAGIHNVGLVTEPTELEPPI